MHVPTANRHVAAWQYGMVRHNKARISVCVRIYLYMWQYGSTWQYSMVRNGHGACTSSSSEPSGGKIGLSSSARKGGAGKFRCDASSHRSIQPSKRRITPKATGCGFNVVARQRQLIGMPLSLLYF